MHAGIHLYQATTNSSRPRDQAPADNNAEGKGAFVPKKGVLGTRKEVVNLFHGHANETGQSLLQLVDGNLFRFSLLLQGAVARADNDADAAAGPMNGIVCL